MLKQYVIVPKSLHMSPGKIASQVAHATFMALNQENNDRVQEWKNGGLTVIVLECKDVQKLKDIEAYLKYWNVINHLYVDEGLTEVLPMTSTVLATGILDDSQHFMLAGFNLYRAENGLDKIKRRIYEMQFFLLFGISIFGVSLAILYTSVTAWSPPMTDIELATILPWVQNFSLIFAIIWFVLILLYTWIYTTYKPSF